MFTYVYTPSSFYICVYISKEFSVCVCVYMSIHTHTRALCMLLLIHGHTRTLCRHVYLHQSIVFIYLYTCMHTHLKLNFCPDSCKELFGNHLPTIIFFKKRLGCSCLASLTLFACLSAVPLIMVTKTLPFVESYFLKKYFISCV